VEELDTNYRSLGRIIAFNEKVFKHAVAADEQYRNIAALSGLTDYVQKVRAGREGLGHVEILSLERHDDDIPEEARVQELIERLRVRGYGLRDIAILTFENDDVVNVTSWLNKQGIPFISYSSLDIRRRRIILEMIALLRFLDSPLDDLSFSTFILGMVFCNTLVREGLERKHMQEFIFANRENRPLYKAFKESYPGPWERCLEGLFRSAGYLPLYDLVTETFRTFDVFSAFREEEASLAKMLEVVKGYEQSGRNSLRDFIGFVSEEDRNEAEWNVDVPKDMEAVKVMTVHKAKGLGFPVVILLVYGKASKGFDHVIREIGDDEACFTRLNQKIACMVDELDELYGELAAKEIVNSLNGLYVALTRAEAEMYVICVHNAGGRENYHHCRFLPADAYPPVGMPQEIYRGKPREFRSIDLRHRAIRAHVPETAEYPMNLGDRQWGAFIHKILSRIQSWDEGDEAAMKDLVKAANRSSGTVYRESEVCGVLVRFLRAPAIREYFVQRDRRTIETETEFADRKGSLFRADRLVIDPARVTVIDFKTGRDRDLEPLSVRQVRDYMSILKDLYPGRKVEGLIAYVESGEVRVVT
jgi:ATP-dependent exoDNAse (exonuclease V) beta subunit